MTPKQEAKEIYNEISNIYFTVDVQFETGFSDVEIDLPDWLIKKIATQLIDRMTHKKGSATEQYWKDVKKALKEL